MIDRNQLQAADGLSPLHLWRLQSFTSCMGRALSAPFEGLLHWRKQLAGLAAQSSRQFQKRKEGWLAQPSL